MVFYGYHGVNQTERQQGQRFHVDVEIGLDLSPAGKSDQLTETIDYAAVYQTVKDIVETKQFCLIEALGEAICQAVLGNDMAQSVTVRIRKPSAPIPGVFDYAQIELTRCRAK